MNTQTQEVRNSINILIKKFNISMDELITICSDINVNITNTTHPVEVVVSDNNNDTQKEKPVEIKKSVNKNTIFTDTNLKNKSWADSDDEDDNFLNISHSAKKDETVSTVSTVSTSNVPDVVSYKKIIKKHSKYTKSNNKYDTKVTKEVYQDSDKEIWEEVPKQELFTKVVKKSISKKNLLVVYELSEFLNCLSEHKKPNIDFIIDDSAHCDHTYEGTLCANVRNCRKIHIQRCIKGESCINKICSFIHKYDMPNDESMDNFDKTMETYNKIKPNKKVKN